MHNSKIKLKLQIIKENWFQFLPIQQQQHSNRAKSPHPTKSSTIFLLVKLPNFQILAYTLSETNILKFFPFSLINVNILDVPIWGIQCTSHLIYPNYHSQKKDLLKTDPRNEKPIKSLQSILMARNGNNFLIREFSATKQGLQINQSQKGKRVCIWFPLPVRKWRRRRRGK